MVLRVCITVVYTRVYPLGVYTSGVYPGVSLGWYLSVYNGVSLGWYLSVYNGGAYPGGVCRVYNGGVYPGGIAQGEREGP